VIEYRFFGGYTIAETADVLDMSTSTVERDWRTAKAWLRRELEE
jgi:DNA-directed RNA polymerase specialized sigma24 family protein